MENRIKRILIDILDIKEGEITESFGPNDAALWDSLNNLRLVTALEEEFGLQLTMNEIHQMGTFAQIIEVIGRHLSS